MTTPTGETAWLAEAGLTCTTGDHPGVPAAGTVRLAECEDDPCTGHPYCAECIKALSTDPENVVLRLWRTDFGWEAPHGAVWTVREYLAFAPEQGDWEWFDHCEGLAAGLLSALHRAGWSIVRLEPWAGNDVYDEFPLWRIVEDGLGGLS